MTGPAVLFGELDASGQRIILIGQGDSWQLNELGMRLRHVTPLLSKAGHGALSVPATWAAVTQISHSFSGNGDGSARWVPLPRLREWIMAEFTRRTAAPSPLKAEFPPWLALRPYQEEGACQIANARKYLLTDEQGIGKTVTTIAGLAEIAARGGTIFPMVVVTPSWDVNDSWAREIAAWAPGWSTVMWGGSGRDIGSALDQAGILITTYATATLDAAGADGPLVKLQPATVVADEVHFMANHRSKRSLAIRRIAAHAANMVELSGTPVKQDMGDAYPALNAMDAASWPSRERFVKRYCQTADAEYGEKIEGLSPLAEPEFRAVMTGSMRRVAKKDVLDQLPPKVHSVRRVEIPPEYRKSYDGMRDDMLAQLPDGPQPVTTPVYTPDGWRQLSDLMPGDAVYNLYGQPTPVRAIRHFGRQPVYQVTFSDRTSTLATAEHRWRVLTRKSRQAKYAASHGDGMILTTRQLMGARLCVPQPHRGPVAAYSRFFLPQQPVLGGIAPATLPLDPYAYGALLGDGHLKGDISISGADDYILHQVQAAAGQIGTTSRFDRYRPACHRVSFHANGKLRAILAELGARVLAAEKCIHPSYLQADEASRRALLAGLLDTDGTVRKGSSAGYSTVSDRLASDTAFLARSLGAVVTSYGPYTRPGKDTQPCHELTMRFPPDRPCPFMLPRKASMWAHNTPATRHPLLTRAFRTIESAGTADTCCIELDTDDDLARVYLTDSTLIPTHNSSLPVMETLAQMTRLSQLASSAADVEVTQELDELTGLEKPHYEVTLKAPSWKADALLGILAERRGQPVVAFAVSRQLIMIAGAACEKAGYRCGYITGQRGKAERTRAISDFQAGKLDVILATTGAGGTGITLTAAGTVVFLQRPWSLADALQAEDRCHRWGSEIHEMVEVIDIVARDSIDESVRDALRAKGSQLASFVRDPRVVREMLGGLK